MSMSFFHHSHFREVRFLLKYLADRCHHAIVIVNFASTAQALPEGSALLDDYSPLSWIVWRILVRVAVHAEKIGAIAAFRAKIPAPIFLPGRPTLDVSSDTSRLEP